MGVGVAVHMGVVCVAGLLDDGIEAVVLVGSVLDVSYRAVGLVQRVASVNLVSVAVLPLTLHVVCVRVVHGVVELVVRLGL